MNKFFGTILGTTICASSMVAAQDDCDCGHNPYVSFELSKPVEMDANPWRVVSVKHFDIDPTQVDEPEVCVVYLQLIPPTDPILYKDFQVIPEDDQEILWNGKWILVSQFSDQMDASECDIAGTQS